MTGASSSDASQRDLHVDAFVDRYVEWREECQALDSAYDDWARSKRSERGIAFATYRAALDREEKAASDYRLVAAVLESPERA